MAESRGDSLARGCFPRLLGILHLSSRCAERPDLVGRAISRRVSNRTSYEASFTEDRAEFIRRDGSLLTTFEVVVSPEDDAEVRRVSIANLEAAPACSGHIVR